MRIEVCVDGVRRRIDGSSGVEIAIKQTFAEQQPRFFAAEPAGKTVLESGGFIGDTRRGGACNVATLTITPHCHGTHTEGVGHLTSTVINLIDTPPPTWLMARLISVRPTAIGSSGENYAAKHDENEAVITAAMLAGVAADGDTPALIVRTLPNPLEKCAHRYCGPNSHPYFTQQAMHCIGNTRVQHLLVDTPSIDRADDGGRLPNHREFWGLPMGPVSDAPMAALGRTITEMVYVPDALADGDYLLSLQLPRLVGDALPSRPLLFNL